MRHNEKCSKAIQQFHFEELRIEKIIKDFSNKKKTKKNEQFYIQPDSWNDSITSTLGPSWNDSFSPIMFCSSKSTSN